MEPSVVKSLCALYGLKAAEHPSPEETGVQLSTVKELQPQDCNSKPTSPVITLQLHLPHAICLRDNHGTVFQRGCPAPYVIWRLFFFLEGVVMQSECHWTKFNPSHVLYNFLVLVTLPAQKLSHLLKISITKQWGMEWSMENTSEKYIQIKNEKTFLGETFWTLEV